MKTRKREGGKGEKVGAEERERDCTIISGKKDICFQGPRRSEYQNGKVGIYQPKRSPGAGSAEAFLVHISGDSVDTTTALYWARIFLVIYEIINVTIY